MFSIPPPPNSEKCEIIEGVRKQIDCKTTKNATVITHF